MHAIVRLVRLGIITVLALFVTSQANSQAQSSPTAAELAAEIETIKREYEARIKALETKLSTLGAKSPPAARAAEASARTVGKTLSNIFNPSIGVVLNGMYTEFSAEESEIPGFQLGHESERPAEGLGLGHSEIAVSSNIDDKFFGQLTLGLGVHPGEPTEVELEEAYIQTLPGAGLPDGLRIKAGRALWTFGYLNEQHTHTDDFVDRPLPYRVYLDNSYNDDGIEASFVLPTDFYSEIGGGLFRGDDTPFAGSDSGLEAWSAYARLGGDIGRNSAWRIGGYVLDGSARERGGGHAHDHGDEDGHADEDAMHEEDHHEDHDEEDGHEDHFANADFFSEGAFTGDARLYGFDVRYTWAPTGNSRERELILQGEHFWVKEKGRYAIQEAAHLDCTTEPHNGHFHTDCESHTPGPEMLGVDTTSRGWYTQAVYKFLPNWRVGARYARLHPPSDAELDHDPYTVGVMADWTNSEFGRIRLQYNRESLSDHEDDDQIILQYIMSLGAHAAHTF
jgi:hypothetical protein